ncbi:MAG: S1C family serine protease, partial [Actinomycetota bacterium]|nr:S1C family serine protease [Actinomycetota bacterium]
PGTVRIDTEVPFQGAIGTGTGVVLSPDGIVLTNNHVIRGADTITATNVGNGQSYPADVIGYDRKNDIAVLQLRGATGLSVAPTVASAGVRVGDQVTAVGFPGGGGLTRSPGTVRGLNRSIVADDDLTGGAERLSGLIEFAADIRPGDSGGPLVDPNGNVVGIVTAGSESYRMDEAGGFAIPLDRALPIADAIRSDAPSGSIHVGPTGILGIGVTSAGRRTAGAPVDGVVRGLPAEQAGIAPGDVITAIDATPIGDATALTDVLDGHHPGDTVTVTYRDRGGNPRSVPVTLAPGPPD